MPDPTAAPGRTPGRRTTVEVTTLYCPESGGQPGDDGTTHHLQPRGPQTARVNACRYCGRTEKQLRDEAEGAAR